jgi:PAS domain S-box-containing protein
MNLKMKAIIVAGAVLLVQTLGLVFIANPLAHAGSSYSVDDPIRVTFFFASFIGFVFVALAYFGFEKFVCARLELLSSENWLQGQMTPAWVQENGDELGKTANSIKQLHLKNNESAERENLIADHALDLICSLNASRTIVAINPASLAQLGYAPVSLMGRPMDRILVEEEVEKLNQTLTRARREAAPAQVDLIIKTMQGTLKDFRWTCEWSESAGLFYCVARDISSEKELERVKQEFFSMVSHDLRTPITSVKGFMTHLEDGGLYGTLSDKGKKQLRGVQENLDRMIRLTTDLLDLDKLEAGQMQLEQETIKVNELITNSVDSVRQIAEQKRINLITQGEDMEAFGDVHRLTQVIVNLLSNAIKFSPEDSSIEVNAVNMRHQVEIQVVDHGRGIPANMMDTIFERYKQVEAADHKVKKGSGLGLAIAKAIVDAHNGQIGVASEEGKGTKFWFRINKPKAGRVTASLRQQNTQAT